MRATKIPDHEERFDSTGKNSSGIKHSLIKKSIQIPGQDEFMEYVDAGLSNGDESYYYKTRYDKDQIVLHYTAGYLRGDMAALSKHDYHVSVPFVIGRNGTIYNLFPSFYWSYHLGRGAIGGNSVRSKKSIGIEISNIGPLKLDGNKLRTYYDSIYCDDNEEEFYNKEPYRDYEYFATFTDEQYTSLIILLKYLTARYKIPAKFLSIAKRYEAGTFVTDFKGIVTHVNYRRTGKTDIGPSFDWDRIINSLKSD